MKFSKGQRRLPHAPKLPAPLHYHVAIDGSRAIVVVCDRRELNATHEHLAGHYHHGWASQMFGTPTDRTIARAARIAERKYRAQREVMERLARRELRALRPVTA